MKLAYSIILFFLFLSNSSQAQPAFNWDRSSATDKEKAGYTCSANLLIMTMGDPQKLEPELGTVATIGGMILSELAAYETIGRTGQDMSMGEIFSIRDQEIKRSKYCWLDIILLQTKFLKIATTVYHGQHLLL